MKKINLNLLVGNRFRTLSDIEGALKNMGATDTTIIFSESDVIEEQDFILDGTINKDKDFSLFYLIDNGGNYYITEINEWG